jgi:hypothetical protein
MIADIIKNQLRENLEMIDKEAKGLVKQKFPTVLFTPKRSKEETQRKTRSNPKNQPSEQTLRAEAVQSLYNKELCQYQISILIQPTTRNLKCDFASKADQVPKL